MQRFLNLLRQAAAPALAAFAFFTPVEAVGQSNPRVRVSIKRVLGPAGTADSFWTQANIEQWIRDTNKIFDRDLGIQLILSEVVDLPDPGPVTGGPSWWTVASANSAHLSVLQGLAEEDPAFYGWRSNAINIYIVNELVGAGGVCSLLSSPHDEIVLIKRNIFNSTMGLCHELGHYFNLLHTFETAFGSESVGVCSYPSPNGATAGDLVADTPADPYLSQAPNAPISARVAMLNSIYGSGSCFGSNSTPFRRLRYNVMSYYDGISTAEALFTPGQRMRAQAALTSARQHIVIREETPAYPLAISGHGGDQGVPNLTISPPRLGRYLQLGVERAPVNALTYFVLGLTRADLPLPLGAMLHPSPDLAVLRVTDSDGRASMPFYLPNHPSLSGLPLYMQSLSLDPAAPGAMVMSDTRRGELFQRMESDFDGDGYADVAIGAPGEGINAAVGAGAVNVVYGGSAGLSGAGNQLWHQDLPGVYGAAENGDAFGSVLAYGDFDDDGFSDLAIGIPSESIGAIPFAGAVQVLRGSPTGLTTVGSSFWTQDTWMIGGLVGMSSQNSDHFGAALAAGDLNGDGYDDLAIGVDGEDVGSAGDAGAVVVLYGSSGGLTASLSQLWTQNSSGVSGACELADHFGQALEIADFDGDGIGDLAVGTPGEDIGGIVDAGLVQILPGTVWGVTSSGELSLHQNATGVLGVAEAGDLLGYDLEAGDFNADGYADLAMGAPGDYGGAGAVQVFLGGPIGLTNVGSQIWSQDSLGVDGVAEVGDQFGFSLSAGDFDADGYDDLAVGVPSENISVFVNCGMVNILEGCSCGLSGGVGRSWSQAYASLGEVLGSGDRFGIALVTGDTNGDGCADLLIGASGEDESVNGSVAADAGVVHVLLGQYHTPGLQTAGSLILRQGHGGLAGAVEGLDRFGASLAR